MGMGNAGGMSGLLGELINHVAQQQGVSPQEVLAQHGVTEDEVHPDNTSHESILGHLMEVAQQNPQLLQGLMATLPALMSRGGQQGAAPASGGTVLGALLGGLAGGAPQQGGGGMLGSLLGGLMGGGQAAPAPAVDPNAPAPTPAVSPQMVQLISGLLGSMNKQ